MSEASIVRIAEACLEAPLLASPWAHVVQAIGRELPEMAVLISLAPGWKGGAPTFAAGVDLEAHPLPETDVPRNPWAEISRRYREGHFGHGFDEFSPRELERTRFYNERLRPAEFGPDVVYGGFPVLRDGVDELLVAVIARTGVTDWNPEHEKLGARIMPHLRQTFLLIERLRFSLIPLEASHSWSSSVLDQICVGALIVDAQGGIRELNLAAEEVLRREGGLRNRAGRLCAVLDAETRELRSAVARAASSKAALGSAVALHDSSGCCFALALVTPLVFGSVLPGCALVWVIPPELPIRDQCDLLRRSFGLSRAEAALAVALAATLNLREAAEVRGIRYETARTYFKRVASKLGVGSQSAVIDRLRTFTWLGGG